MGIENKLDRIKWADRRHDARIVVNAPVEIGEIDEHGRQITERTFIEDVSDFGCRFSIRGTVQKGDTVSIRILNLDGKALPESAAKLFEVMWVGKTPSSCVVGARIRHGEKIDRSKIPMNADDALIPAK